MLEKILEAKYLEMENFPEYSSGRTKGFYDPVESLRRKPFIAEVKKASPSAGNINNNVSPLSQALEYEKHGAGAISVLTDTQFFKGSFEYLEEISKNTSLPILCKDFIVSEKQIKAAYACGADFILLIASVLKEAMLEFLSHKAEEYGLKVLYEIHSFEEFEKIIPLAPTIVGVNARDLETFKIDKDKAYRTLKNLKGDFIKVAESGILQTSDIVYFRESGADAFLVGTALMKSGNIGKSFEDFYKGLT